MASKSIFIGMADILKQYITTILLNEVPKWKSMANELPTVDQERFAHPEKEIGKFVGQPYHYLHFAKFQKIGINPRSEFTTPLGIYAYPLTDKFYREALENKIPFASEEPYAICFHAVNPAKILVMKHYKEENLKRDIQKLKILFPGVAEKKLAYLANEEEYQDAKTSSEKLWVMAKFFAGMAMDEYEADSFYNHSNDKKTIRFNPHPRNWRRILVQLGYEGVQDDGMAVIHNSEPSQAVFFSANAIEENFSGPNPFLKFKRKDNRIQAKKLGDQMVNSPEQEPGVRHLSSVVKNPAIFKKVLEKVSGSQDFEYIKRFINKMPMFNQQETRNSAVMLLNTFKTSDFFVRVELVKKLPSWIVGRMGDDNDPEIRRLVADKIPENYAAAMLDKEKARKDSDDTIIKILKRRIPK